MEVVAPVQFSDVDDAGLDGPERDARRVLNGLGFKAEKVATASDKTADFSVDGDTPAYLVEVKSRLLDERLRLPGKVRDDRRCAPPGRGGIRLGSS